MRMQAWLEQIWYDPGRRVPLWLRALALVYRGALWLKSCAYRNGWRTTVTLPVPVVVVGNLGVGGTGKTPLTIWLMRQLAACGFRVGAVLRGYGGRQHAARLLDEGDGADQVGDEALLIRQHTGCPVAVGADRVAAAHCLMAAGVQLIIADDGLQHLRLGRAAEIAVVDGQRGLGNGRLLPAGPLREPAQRLDGVTAIVVNVAGRVASGAAGRASDARLLVAGAIPMNLAGSELQPAGRMLAGRPAVALGLLGATTVHGVAGIGNPDRFFAQLRSAGLTVIEHAFADHHPYRERELLFGDRLPVLMTEKDAVKCRELALPNHWYLPVAAQFEPADARRLLEKIVMDSRLLDLLVCPLCKGPLRYDKAQSLLVCRAERLAYPIRDGVPVMLEDEARALPADDPLLSR